MYINLSHIYLSNICLSIYLEFQSTLEHDRDVRMQSLKDKLLQLGKLYSHHEQYFPIGTFIVNIYPYTSLSLSLSLSLSYKVARATLLSIKMEARFHS